ncbi:hypothetical protein EDC04DRAFT_2863644, partial [Pisolithus marmoratus]
MSEPRFMRWEAASDTSVSFSVPGNWKSGRLWGRCDSDPSTNLSANSCLDDGCDSGLGCEPNTGTVKSLV